MKLKYHPENNWTRLNIKDFSIFDHSLSSNGIVFKKKEDFKKLILYINI